MNKTTKTVLLVLAALGALSCLCLGGVMALGLVGGDSVSASASADDDDGDFPPPAVKLDGARQEWGGYSFVAPPGMAAALGPDGFQLSMKSAEGGSCTIVLLPMQPASGALDAQALAIMLKSIERDFSGVRDEYGNSEPLKFQRAGVTAEGREYVDIPSCMLLDKQGAPTGASVQLMAMRVGDKVAPVLGLEGGLRCLNELGTVRQQWLRLFYSLEFPGVDAPGGADLKRRLLGKWQTGSAMGVVSERYRDDGRYEFLGGFRTQREVGETLVKETQYTATGDGTWALHGNKLTRTPDGKPGETAWLRITRSPNTSRPDGQLESLRELKVGVDGFVYESSLTRVE